MELLLLLGLFVAALWCAVVCLRGGLLAGCLLVLLAGSCFGSPFFSLPGGPVPLTIDRLLWAALLLQYLVWRRWRMTVATGLRSADVVVLLFIGMLLASIVTHDWQFMKGLPVSYFVFFFVMPLGLYWVARQTPQTERGTYVMFACCAAFGAYLAFTAVAETRQWTALIVPRYISSPDFIEFLGRGRGPFLNPANCGLYQSACLFAALLCWPRLSRAGRWALGGFSLLMLLGIYCTLTRSAWMGGALGLLIVVGCTLPRSWRMPLVAGSLLASTLLVATQWENLLAFKRDKELSAQEVAESAKLRPLLAQIAWMMFQDQPLFGCGFGQYLSLNADYANDRGVDMPLVKSVPYVQHNVWLALLVETGLVGAGLFTLLMVLWARHAWRLWSSPELPDWVRRLGLWYLATLGAYFPNAMFQDVSIVPMVNMLMFFLAGLVEAATVQWLPHTDGPRVSTSLASWLWPQVSQPSDAPCR